MPRIDPDSPDVPTREGTGYPGDYAIPCRARSYKRLGRAGGLVDFGVNLVTVPPGSWSSQRHAHVDDDEFVMMVEGELVLIEDAGRTLLRAGDYAAFPKGTGDGHHLVNESDAPARFVAIGANKGAGTYPDIDLIFLVGGAYAHKDGTPY
jgi:uncharacterized cupin superfamily protein